jgi:peptide-methionine (S)-S-oxide reductase
MSLPPRVPARALSLHVFLPLIVILLLAVGLPTRVSPAAETARAIPPPTLDEASASQGSSEIAILAGGCFWGVQGVFQHTEGVIAAISGYAGGDARTAHYEMVGSGTTGHAEAVRITYDPRRITYGRLLQIYFSVAHDPTELDRQGPDIGTQYRSAIFPTTSEQRRIAQTYIAQLGEAHVFGSPIVTKIEPGREFFPAEAYHQDYLTLHPTQPYIALNDLPKIDELRRLFPALFRTAPALTGSTGSRG